MANSKASEVDARLDAIALFYRHKFPIHTFFSMFRTISRLYGQAAIDIKDAAKGLSCEDEDASAVLSKAENYAKYFEARSDAAKSLTISAFGAFEKASDDFDMLDPWWEWS